MAIVGVAEVSAHRRDEYLQAARLAIDPGGVQTRTGPDAGHRPGRGDPRGHRSQSRRIAVRGRAAGLWSLVLSALTLEIDGTPVRAQLGDISFPDAEAMRRGEGTIRLQSAATLPRLSIGRPSAAVPQQPPSGSAVSISRTRWCPSSDEVAVTAQRRDGDQTELTIDYVAACSAGDVHGRVAAGQHRLRDCAAVVPTQL